MTECSRCGSTENLEEDHIIPRSQGGSDDASNKRWLCRGCHDYRHARVFIIKQINTQLHYAKNYTEHFNSAKLSLLIFRLGVLEAFNTPETIRERGYVSYWELPQTHYSHWYPQIRLKDVKRGRINPAKETTTVFKLDHFSSQKKPDSEE